MSSALYLEIPAGTRKGMEGALGFRPPKAQPGGGHVPPTSPWPSRPLEPKLAMVAPAPMAQLMAAALVPPPHPNWLVVAEIAARAFVLLKYLASPV